MLNTVLYCFHGSIMLFFLTYFATKGSKFPILLEIPVTEPVQARQRYFEPEIMHEIKYISNGYHIEALQVILPSHRLI